MMVAVTGVSGSGKSTLVHEVIYKALAGRLRKRRGRGEAEEAYGMEAAPVQVSGERAELLTDVVLVDQSPIGRTPRSNPVTYIKAST